jgi:hypothetical protein
LLGGKIRTYARSRMGFKILSAVVVAAAIVVAAVVAGHSTSSEPSAADRRICTIGRDIAADYGVTDRFERSQQRVAALAARYADAASAPIAAALVSWANNIDGADPNLDLAYGTMSAFTDACAAAGL